MEEDVGLVILINKFSVDPQEPDQFLKRWAIGTEKCKSQPGFILTQLHKGIGENGPFINYAGQNVCLSSQHSCISAFVQESFSAGICGINFVTCEN